MEKKQSDECAQNNQPDKSEAHGSSDFRGSAKAMDIGPLKLNVTPGLAASPPQFVSLEDIMSVANGVIDMHLAHEIVLDQDFRLEKYVPQNSLEKVVKEAVHKAFWDLLIEDLNATPPRYTHAMKLLEEIKGDLLELLLPHHTKLKQEINETLDIPLIQQQADNNSLDFLSYAQYVLAIMGKLCAPVRDDDVNELMKATDIVEIFKGIFDVLTQMKLDLANFHIQVFRPEILAHSIEFEKKRFAELLKVNGGVDTLVSSKKWLKKHVEKSLAEKPNCSAVDVMPTAYLDLLEWDQGDPLPETVVMDSSRLQALSCRLYRLIITGSILLVTLSNLKLSVLQSSQSFKDTLIKEIGIVLHDTREDDTLKTLLPNLALQVFEAARKFLASLDVSSLQPIVLDPLMEKNLMLVIQDLEKPSHPVRSLVRTRIKEFLQMTLSSLPNITHQVPSGLTSLKLDLLSLTANIVRLYEYNQAVFGEYYSEIISKLNEEVVSERAQKQN